MSLALLTETAREVRRLAQAGSDLARGDFRLERLREPLAATGAKVPVFAKLAEAIGALTAAASAADTPDRLLTVATLAQAILATQAETGVGTGELRPLPTTPAPGGTMTPYRQLEPVLTALSTTGSGRLEIVKHAFEQGHFHDLRLAATAVRGLGDLAADIAGFLAETVLPSLGAGIVPLLRVGLDLQGGREHARRLALIARFQGPAANGLYREAAQNGSKEVRVEAAAALRHDPASAPQLRDLAKKGPREVRAAALGSLVHLDPESDVPLLVETLRGPNGAEIALPAVRANPSPTLPAVLVAAGRADLSTLLATPAGQEASKATEAFITLLRALGNRPDPEEVTTFLGECLEQTPSLAAHAPSSAGTSAAVAPQQVAYALLRVGTPRALERLASARGRFDRWLLGPAFRAAAVCQSPTELFDGFAPYLDSGKPTERDAVLGELRQLVCFQPAFRLGGRTNLPHQGGIYHGDTRLPMPKNREGIVWDPRWRARLMELDGWKAGVLGAVTRALLGGGTPKPGTGGKRLFELHEIVAALTAPGDATALRYLEAQLGNLPSAKRAGQWSETTWYGEAIVLLGLIQGGYPRAAELLFESAQRVSKLTHVGYQAMALRDVAGKLPPAQLAALIYRVSDLPEGDTRTELLLAAATSPTSPEPASPEPTS